MKIQFNKEQLNNDKKVKLAHIQYIQGELGLRPLTSSTVSFFYYNFPKILQLVELIICQQVLVTKENNISQRNIINVEKISSLKEKFQLSVIIYAVLLALFQVKLEMSTDHEGFILLRRNIILHHQLNSVVICLQILIERLFADEFAKFKQFNIYSKIKSLITQNLNTMKINKKQKIDLIYSQRSTEIEYRRQILIKNQSNLYPDYLQVNYSSQNVSKKDAMGDFFEQIIFFFNKKQIEQTQITTIIEQIKMILGMITFYQTIKSNHQFDYKCLSQQIKKQIAIINKYNLTIQIFQEYCNGKKQMKIRFCVIFQHENIQRVNQTVFIHSQKRLGQFLLSKGYSSKYIYINQLIYQIDPNQILSQSDFHEIYRAQSLQLQSIISSKNNHKKILSFVKKSIIIKTIQRDKRKSMVPSQTDEIIILNLLKQVKHKQQIKLWKRKLHLSTERTLIGIDKIINVVQIFTVQKDNNSEETPVQYLVFQRCKQDLMKLGIKERLKAISTENRANIIFNIFKQITEGLICLHFDIQQLYPVELNHYFNLNKPNKTKIQNKLSISYGNIKPSNIMIDYLTDIALSSITFINFCKSKISKDNQKDYGFDGHCLYTMAPETKNIRCNNQKIDIWGLGVMLLETINESQTIFKTPLNQKQLAKKLVEMQLQSIYNQKWFWILNGLLRHHPQERLNAQQLFNYMTSNEFYLVHNDLQTFKKRFKGKICFEIAGKDKNNTNQENNNQELLRNICFKILHYNDKIWPQISIIRLFTLSSLLNSRVDENQENLLMVWMVLCFIEFIGKGQYQKINLAANTILVVSSQQSKCIIAGTLEQKQKQAEKKRFVSALSNNVCLQKNNCQQIYQISNLSIIYGKQSKQLYLLLNDKPLYKHESATPFFYGFSLASAKDLLIHFKAKLFYYSLLQNIPCYKKVEDGNILLLKKINYHKAEIVFYKVKNFVEKIENLLGELIQIAKNFNGFKVSFNFDESEITNQIFVPVARITSTQNQCIISINLTTIKFVLKIFNEQSYSLTSQFRQSLCSFIQFQLQETNYPNFQQIYKLSTLLKSGSVVEYEKTIQKISKYAINPKITFGSLESLIAELFTILNTIQEGIVKRSLFNLADNLLSFTYILSKHIESTFKIIICTNLEKKLSNRIRNGDLLLIFKSIKRYDTFLNNLPLPVNEKDRVNNFANHLKELIPNFEMLMYLFYQI